MSLNAPYSRFGASLAFITAVFHARSILACAACYGQSDSPMAAGMNWGIMSLLGMIVVVLGGVAAFFIFLARRSAALAKTNLESERILIEGVISAKFSAQAAELPAASIAMRGGLKQISTLAQRRKACATPPTEPRRQGIPRGRS